MHSNFINLWKVFELSFIEPIYSNCDLVEAFTVSMVIGELSILIELLLSAIEDGNKRDSLFWLEIQNGSLLLAICGYYGYTELTG